MKSKRIKQSSRKAGLSISVLLKHQLLQEGEKKTASAIALVALKIISREKTSESSMGTAPKHSGERHLAHAQRPKTTQFHLNLKPTNCSDKTKETTWHGERIGLLTEKICLYIKSIFRDKNTFGNATERGHPHTSQSEHSDITLHQPAV